MLLFLLIPLAAASVKWAINGSSWVDVNSKERRFVIGVDYQPGGASAYDPATGADPLSDREQCLRDAALLQQLGANVIRVYTINPRTNHDECMSIFNAAGIGLLLDVNSPRGGESLERLRPGRSYNAGYLTRVFEVIDAFMGYPNLLGFFSGNEIVNDPTSASLAPPYIRALQRDMKAYIKKHADRAIPVGYSAADEATLRIEMWRYLSCGDSDSASDFFGINTYAWCGDATYTTSGYDKLTSEFSGSSIPIFFSEYGCNIEPRRFLDVPVLYSNQMWNTFSGGLIYEYSEEPNHFGLVKLLPDGNVEPLPSYSNLQNAFANANLPSLPKNVPSPLPRPSCDPSWFNDGYFNANMDLPRLPIAELIEQGSGNPNIGKLIETDLPSSSYQIVTSTGEKIPLPLIRKYETTDDRSTISKTRNYPPERILGTSKSATITPEHAPVGKSEKGKAESTSKKANAVAMSLSRALFILALAAHAL